MNERRLIGLAIAIVGAALIAPKETSLLIDALSKPKESEGEKPEQAKNDDLVVEVVEVKPTEKLGLIRRTKKNIILAANKFWKWLY